MYKYQPIFVLEEMTGIVGRGVLALDWIYSLSPILIISLELKVVLITITVILNSVN